MIGAPRLLNSFETDILPDKLFSDLQLDKILSAQTIAVLQKKCERDEIVRRNELFALLDKDENEARIENTLAVLNDGERALRLLGCANIPLDKYKSEVKKSGKFAKLRNYKNRYFNVKILPCGEDYKILAMRMPSTSDYKIPAHFIVGKDSNGNWKIKEESMNTRVQKFLKNS